MYDFQFLTTGNCITEATAGFDNIGVSDEECVPLTIVPPTGELPDAQQNVAYNHTILFSGSGPVNLTDIVKPAWMNIVVTGNSVNLSGTPVLDGAVGEDIEVSFTFGNNCSEDTTDFSDLIDVLSDDDCIAVSLEEPFAITDAIVGEPFEMLIALDGSEPFVLSDIVKPSWMVIEVIGDVIHITGTPDETNIADDVAVHITVNNCAGIPLLIDFEIDVEAAEGGRHRNIANYYADPGEVSGVCTLNAIFTRSAEAVDDSVTANERIKVTARVTTDNFCVQDIEVIFEVGDDEVDVAIDMTCGGGSNYCAGGSIEILLVEVIP
jgi:hypothetical protein